MRGTFAEGGQRSPVVVGGGLLMGGGAPAAVAGGLAQTIFDQGGLVVPAAHIAIAMPPPRRGLWATTARRVTRKWVTAAHPSTLFPARVRLPSPLRAVIPPLPPSLLFPFLLISAPRHRLRALSYHETDVFLLCFSLVHRASLENVTSSWAPELRRASPDSTVILVGTKSDLRTDPAEVAKLASRHTTPVSTDEGKHAARTIGAACYHECSALTQHGLKDVFDDALRLTLYTQGGGGEAKKAAQQKGCCTIS